MMFVVLNTYIYIYMYLLDMDGQQRESKTLLNLPAQLPVCDDQPILSCQVKPTVGPSPVFRLHHPVIEYALDLD